MAALSGRVLLQLFLRLGVLLGLLGGVGGLLALNSELSRAAVSVPMESVGALFWLGLPEVLFHLLPLCAVLSLVWTGATLRESQTWMGLQLLGLGGGALWRPVVGFSVGVGLAVGVLAHAKSGSEDAQHQRLLDAAEVVPGQPIAVQGLELHAKAGGLGGLRDVRLSSVSPGLQGAAESAVVDPVSGEVSLNKGVLFVQEGPSMVVEFDALTLGVPDWPRGDVDSVKEVLEDHKRWSWPLMAALLCGLVWPLALQGRAVASLGAWLVLWGIVRSCDHLLPQLGASLAALLPLALIALATVSAWWLWEEA